ncbi:sigma factor-like helix-turn-helix DNA-binding protein [Alicyclobacillus sendaiensis]|uniref:Sigma factor-like helix-turn-helix DNA-binding protein n=1 Tax=Alicyclobacillus sendaiensis PA2 TaxID=3029425 RepID=A0ABT6Y1X6_ALISE|nr:sigma factor-like helix-turn-helix DNA-binding protein [Alicyclobacillus sendaiensis]MDI9261335.1 sigma factor-like helix-turn-helix DNA-binding protein [Alicyclobacillus sendaiensis PA2]
MYVADTTMQELIEEYRAHRRLLLTQLRELDRAARQRQRVFQRIRSMSWPKWMRLDLEQYAETRDRQYLEDFLYQAQAVWETLTPKQQAAIEDVRRMVEELRGEEMDRSLLRSMARDMLYVLSQMARYGAVQEQLLWEREELSRHRVTRAAAVQEALERLAVQESFEDELLALLSGEAEERPRVRVSFHQLSPQQREALKLALQGFSRKEIAEMLHVRKGTADVHVRRGRKKFKNGVQLALDLGDDEE